MAFNVQGSVQIPLSIFGSLVTEQAPESLPDGVSPACSDVVFAPGQVGSRGALQKVFGTRFPASGSQPIATVAYAKSYVTPSGNLINLYLDSNGNFWWEDVKNSPGTYSLLGVVSSGSFAKSVTAFGREYIAFSDGSHGTEVALQCADLNGVVPPALDRVTQDGPGQSPTVQSFSLPSVNLAASGAISLAGVEADPQAPGPGGYFTQINAFTNSSVAGINPGALLTLSGYTSTAAPMNGTWTVTAVFATGGLNLVQLVAYLPPTTVFGTGGSGSATTGYLVRSGNIVTATTASAHQLQVGYQVQIANVPVSYVGGTNPPSTYVTSIVINNESLPGIATVTTPSPHGLVPGISVAITGVLAVTVGTSISSITWAGGIVTVTTSTAHGLTPGAIVTITGITGATGYNTTADIINVMSPTTFTYPLPLSTAPTGSPSGGTVTLNWPITDTPDPTLFEVVSAPTATTFQVAVNYSDGTWVTGLVSYAWNGTFYVTAVPTATSFQYKQYGPNQSTSGSGTATPFGQITPGLHQLQCSFLTRQGYLTRPSPPVSFQAPGGQYLALSNIPIGPPNIVARVFELTGAEGSFFFYLPTIPQVEGTIVGTATQLNDNASTSMTIDVADNTLFAGIGTSVSGNNLANQLVIDGALGFGYYESRLVTYGQRNRIQNFLSMGFEGGSVTTTPAGGGSPVVTVCGWTTASGGSLVNGHYGVVWQTSGTSSLVQPAYEDGYGVPIVAANTKYIFRAWINYGSSGVKFLTATLSSASGGWSVSAPITFSNTFGNGEFFQFPFSAATPSFINSDTILTISTITSSVQIDDLSIIYAETPYTNSVCLGSYVNNPEAFDGVTGVFGPSDDSHQIMEVVAMQGALFQLTLDPGGRIHRVNNNGTTEPAYWPIAQVGSNCGSLGPFAVTVSQADDSTASGGEEWFAWASATGAKIYDGSQPWKITQEIEPDWEAIIMGQPGSGPYVLGQNVQTGTWALNDPVARVIYFGIASTLGPVLGGGVSTSAPNLVYVLNYRELDTAYLIGNSPPIHTSLSGKLIATDHTRKWTPWKLPLNGASLMYRAQGGGLQPVFFAGNAQQLTLAAGFGNVYTLNAAKYTDDDYGQIFPYYAIAFLPTVESGQATGLGGVRNILKYLTTYIAGLGTLTITPLVNNLTNAWSITGARNLEANPNNDQEWAGGSATGQRISLKFSTAPPVGVVNTFTAGDAVNWVSGANFAGLAAGGTVVINTAPYTIATIPNLVTMTLTTSPGNQSGVAWGLATPDNWFLLQRVLAMFARVTHLPVRGKSA